MDNLPQPKETALQLQIKNYLEATGWYVMRLNSGAMRDKRNRLVRMSPAGTPDLMAFKKARLLFIEVKRKGNKPTQLQEFKMNELREHGAMCIVASDYMEVEQYLKGGGI